MTQPASRIIMKNPTEKQLTHHDATFFFPLPTAQLKAVRDAIDKHLAEE